MWCGVQTIHLPFGWSAAAWSSFSYDFFFFCCCCWPKEDPSITVLLLHRLYSRGEWGAANPFPPKKTNTHTRPQQQHWHPTLVLRLRQQKVTIPDGRSRNKRGVVLFQLLLLLLLFLLSWQMEQKLKDGGWNCMFDGVTQRGPHAGLVMVSEEGKFPYTNVCPSSRSYFVPCCNMQPRETI